MKIAVIGSNMVDLTSYITRMPVLGETLEAPDFSMGCGGEKAPIRLLLPQNTAQMS